MDRKQAIEAIKCLYPADVNEKGKELLLRAIYDEWESLPDNILKRYAQLCIWEENRIINKARGDY